MLLYVGLLHKLAKKYQKEREDSDDEDNIPSMELSKRLKANKAMEQQQNEDSRAEESEGVIEETMDFEPATDSDSLRLILMKMLIMLCL